MKTMKKICLLSMCMVMGLSLGACSKGNEETPQTPSANKTLAADQVFRFSASNPTSLDPSFYRDDDAGQLIVMMNEPLIRRGIDSTHWEPGLASDMVISEDNLKYTLTLREGLKWSDDSPITTEDILFSFQRVVDPQAGSPNAFDYYSIKNGEKINKGELPVADLGVKDLGNNQIEIELERPLDYFPQLLTNARMAPVQKAMVETHKDLYGTDDKKVVASGPFRMESWEQDYRVILVKNENYWDAENVTLERIEMEMIKDGNAKIGLYDTGGLDILDVGKDYIAQYENEPGFNSMPRAGVQMIEFNPKKPYLDNVKIRQALSMAFDRTVYTNDILKNNSIPAYGLIPAGVRGKEGGFYRDQYGPMVTDISSDPKALEKANQLLEDGLKEMGKTKADMMKDVEIQCIDSEGSKVAAQAIQAMWQQNLDLELTLIPLQVSMLLPMLENQTFTIVIGGSRVANVDDPADFVDFIYNEGKWDNPEYNKIIEASREVVGDERMDLIAQAEQLVLDNYVFIPQAYVVSNYVVRDGVEGLRVSSTAPRFDFKYVEVYE